MIYLVPKCLNIHSHLDLKSLSFSTESTNVLLPIPWNFFSLSLRAYDGLREPPSRIVEASLPRGGSPWLTARWSWRSLSPEEHLCRQCPLRGPTPETWVLTNHQQPDTTTLQRRGCCPRRSTLCPCTPPTATRTSSRRSSCYHEPSQVCRSKSVQSTC